MIQPFDYGEVHCFRMARGVFGRPLFWTGVYLLDGLLVDAGPPNLAREVAHLGAPVTLVTQVTSVS